MIIRLDGRVKTKGDLVNYIIIVIISRKSTHEIEDVHFARNQTANNCMRAMVARPLGLLDG